MLPSSSPTRPTQQNEEEEEEEDEHTMENNNNKNKSNNNNNKDKTTSNKPKSSNNKNKNSNNQEKDELLVCSKHSTERSSSSSRNTTAAIPRRMESSTAAAAEEWMNKLSEYGTLTQVNCIYQALFSSLHQIGGLHSNSSSLQEFQKDLVDYGKKHKKRICQSHIDNCGRFVFVPKERIETREEYFLHRLLLSAKEQPNNAKDKTTKATAAAEAATAEGGDSTPEEEEEEEEKKAHEEQPPQKKAKSSNTSSSPISTMAVLLPIIADLFRVPITLYTIFDSKPKTQRNGSRKVQFRTAFVEKKSIKLLSYSRFDGCLRQPIPASIILVEDQSFLPTFQLFWLDPTNNAANNTPTTHHPKFNTKLTATTAITTDTNPKQPSDQEEEEEEEEEAEEATTPNNNKIKKKKKSEEESPKSPSSSPPNDNKKHSFAFLMNYYQSTKQLHEALLSNDNTIAEEACGYLSHLTFHEYLPIQHNLSTTDNNHNNNEDGDHDEEDIPILHTMIHDGTLQVLLRAMSKSTSSNSFHQLALNVLLDLTKYAIKYDGEFFNPTTTVEKEDKNKSSQQQQNRFICPSMLVDAQIISHVLDSMKRYSDDIFVQQPACEVIFCLLQQMNPITSKQHISWSDQETKSNDDTTTTTLAAQQQVLSMLRENPEPVRHAAVEWFVCEAERLMDMIENGIDMIEMEEDYDEEDYSYNEMKRQQEQNDDDDDVDKKRIKRPRKTDGNHMEMDTMIVSPTPNKNTIFPTSSSSLLFDVPKINDPFLDDRNNNNNNTPMNLILGSEDHGMLFEAMMKQNHSTPKIQQQKQRKKQSSETAGEAAQMLIRLSSRENNNNNDANNASTVSSCSVQGGNIIGTNNHHHHPILPFPPPVTRGGNNNNNNMILNTKKKYDNNDDNMPSLSADVEFLGTTTSSYVPDTIQNKNNNNLLRERISKTTTIPTINPIPITTTATTITGVGNTSGSNSKSLLQPSVSLKRSLSPIPVASYSYPSPSITNTNTTTNTSTRKRKKKRNRNPQRCMRCGKEKDGKHHSGGAPLTSLEYCTVPETERLLYWTPMPGYKVGDTERALSYKDMKSRWKGIKERAGINMDEENFPGW